MKSKIDISSTSIDYSLYPEADPSHAIMFLQQTFDQM